MDLILEPKEIFDAYRTPIVQQTAKIQLFCGKRDEYAGILCNMIRKNHYLCGILFLILIFVLQIHYPYINHYE